MSIKTFPIREKYRSRSGWKSSRKHTCNEPDLREPCHACDDEFKHDVDMGLVNPGSKGSLVELLGRPIDEDDSRVVIDSVLTNDKPDFREDGERSKHMPADMSDRYERSLQDTELLNLRRDLAMMEARIHDLMDTVNQGESTGAWNELRLCGERFTSLWGRRDMERAQEQLMTMLEIIEHGSTRANGWDELQRTIELRRRLSETETKRLQALKQFVTAERAVTLVEDVIEVIRRHVHDPEARRNCVRDLKRLIVTTDNRGD
jgi:hypothetical protein